MKLTICERSSSKKSEAKKLRREGSIPAILYGSKGEPRSIYINKSEMETSLRQIEPQHLATTIFELEENGKSLKAIVKDIQYHPVSYAILHMDFQYLTENVPITVNVPIQILGAAECIGVKLGGYLRQVIRSLKVTCLPKDLPREFPLDILNLNVSETLRLSDITLPAGVKSQSKMGEVAVVIAKKA